MKMSGENGYKYCMEACVEYLVTIYQEGEENAVSYCRRLCASYKKHRIPLGMIAIIRRLGGKVIGKRSL